MVTILHKKELIKSLESNILSEILKYYDICLPEGNIPVTDKKIFSPLVQCMISSKVHISSIVQEIINRTKINLKDMNLLEKINTNLSKKSDNEWGAFPIDMDFEGGIKPFSSEMIYSMKKNEIWTGLHVDNALRIFLLYGIHKILPCGKTVISEFVKQNKSVQPYMKTNFEKCIRDSHVAEHIINHFFAFSNISIFDPTKMYLYFGTLSVSVCVISSFFLLIILIVLISYT